MKKVWAIIFAVCLVVFLFCLGTFIYDGAQKNEGENDLKDYTIPFKRSDEIHKVVLWSPAGNMVELMNRHFEKEGNKLENGNVQYGSFELAKEMYETIQKWKTYEGLDNFKGKVMIIQGKKDLSVPYLFAARYAVSYKNSHLYYVDGAGHGYDAPEHSSKLYNLTVEFLKNE